MVHKRSDTNLGDMTSARRGGAVERERLCARLAFTRYCHHQYCMMYGIKDGGRWKGVDCAMDM